MRSLALFLHLGYLSSMSHDDLPASFRAAVRQRGHALAALETAVDPTMVADMTGLRLRAERRAGEVMLELVRRGDTAAVKRLLVENIISRDAAGRWQRLGAMDADEFERKVTKRVALAVAGLTNAAPARAEVME
jgi:hypothetical protein